ncbi:hypothetical protein BKA70DRAFT_1444717 [Coprinopsis sp. MPI-PUGE-AT-0042]|nr:hypothetical protein BKA70DRAFT_1444717 [Coprinopsis sp. MPI-PUGE-AT-0042]
MPAESPQTSATQNTYHHRRPVSSTPEGDTLNTVMDLSPYVGCPIQTLAEEADEEEHVEAPQGTAPQGTKWDLLTRAIGLSFHLCNIAPQNTNGESDEQLEMQEAGFETKASSTNANTTVNTQPPPSPACMQTKQRKTKEIWVVEYKIPLRLKLEVGQRVRLENVGTSTRRLGIVSTIAERTKTEVVFRIIEDPLIDPNTFIYLSIPFRGTKLARDEGALSWLVTNLFLRGRSLKDPSVKAAEDAQTKAKSDEARKHLEETHTLPKRVRAGARARTNSLKPTSNATPQQPLQSLFVETPQLSDKQKDRKGKGVERAAPAKLEANAMFETGYPKRKETKTVG